MHCVVFRTAATPKRSPARERYWVFDPKPSFRVHVRSTPSAASGVYREHSTGPHQVGRNILEKNRETPLIDAARPVLPARGCAPCAPEAVSGSPSVVARASLRITSLYPSPAMRSRRRAARVPWSIHKPTPSRRRGIELGERRAQGVEARGVVKPVFYGRFRSGERAAPLQRPPPPPRFPVLFCA